MTLGWTTLVFKDPTDTAEKKFISNLALKPKTITVFLSQSTISS